MFKQTHVELTRKLLESIKFKNDELSLKNGKQLFEVVFGKRFADEIDKNGILRYKSLLGPEENIQYFGILYENAPQSGVYENFSLS